jgi:hypothetical protein
MQVSFPSFRARSRRWCDRYSYVSLSRLVLKCFSSLGVGGGCADSRQGRGAWLLLNKSTLSPFLFNPTLLIFSLSLDISYQYLILCPTCHRRQMNAIVIVNLPIQITLICIIATIPIQIFIKTLTGRKQAFNFEPENQVLAVKQALQEKEGIQVDQIRLIFSGKQLSDDRSLESYTITAGATIHMVLQLRGGR